QAFPPRDDWHSISRALLAALAGCDGGRATGRSKVEPAQMAALPKPAGAKHRDHPHLLTAGMAANEHLALFALTDREARFAIIMRRAARHPAGAGPAATEDLRNVFSGHGAPRGCHERLIARDYRSQP